MLIVHPPAGLTAATTLPRAPGLRWLLQLQVLGSCWYICTTDNTSEGTIVGKKSQEKMAKKNHCTVPLWDEEAEKSVTSVAIV